MNLTSTPPTMPLEAGINRCLAHGDRPGEWCERREQCAAHITIRHDSGLNVPTVYRKCWSDQYPAFIPVNGWEEEDDEVPAVDWESGKGIKA